MRHNRNWKKTGSAFLAVCLIAALLLSNQSFGVLAEEDQSQEIIQEEETSESATEETSQDIDEAVNTDETENDDEDNSYETENDDEDSTYETENDDEDNSGETENDNEDNTDTDIELTPEDGFYSEEASEADVVLDQEDTAGKNSEEEIDILSDEADTITMDLYYGDILFSDNEVTYYDTDSIQKSIPYEQGKKYRIVQKNHESSTNHTISVGTENMAVTKSYTIYLAGVNIDAPGEQDNHKAAIYVNTAENTVNLVLENNSKNTVVAHAYGTAETDLSTHFTHSAIEKEINTKGTLRLTCEDGLNQQGHDCTNTGSCGLLTATAKSNGRVYWNGAGIGSKGYIGNNRDHSGSESASGTMYNLVIAGGVITATGASGNGNGGGPGIGIAQSGPDSAAVGYNAKGMEIDGGYIIAKAGNGATANIGGGFHSGYVEMVINGGYVEALRGDWNIGSWFQADVGAAIGGGSGGSSTSAFYGTTVIINGGTIKASAAYGAAIGSSAGGSSGDGAPATIIINGGTIEASTKKGYGAAVGTGGSAAQETTSGNTGKASDANITINGGIITASSQYGADIGGGGTQSTQESAVGGNAIITITDGIITTTGNGLGGGMALAGKGGNASVNVSGGTINTTSIGGGDSNSNKAGDASINISSGKLDVKGRIGGGNSVSGTPGSVSSEAQSAGVVVTGGTLKVGTIGGGTNTNGDIGFATADISGGDIQGQFILSNTDESKKCTFTMSGGTIDNTALWLDAENSKYQTAQKNGGAVYLTDPKGEVNISGGTIQNCKAELGGAVYMTAGTVNLSGTGKIQNCKAIGNTEKNIEALGGAIYLEDGTVNVSGGEISGCSATNGAAVYMQGGSMAVSGGSVKNNTATRYGAGAYLAEGNLDISGGDFTENGAVNGAGAYLSGGNLNVSGTGTFNLNNASENGGAAYLANGTLTLDGGTVSKNTATSNGGGFYVADGAVRMFGGNITGNHADHDGGGFYVSSAENAANVFIRSGSITDNTSGGSGAGLAVIGGKNPKADTVVLGLLEKHEGLDITDTSRSFKPFDYTDTVDNTEHNHTSCPVLQGNIADGDGGGIYMQSSAANLNIYCLEESGNTSRTNGNGDGVMMAGGNLVIGDKAHNDNTAWGNTVVNSRMLIEGGTVDIWGSMDNPLFEKNILVDMQAGAGKFTDHRKQASDKKRYKIQYFEDFTAGGTQTASGMYIASQYDIEDKITASGTLFKHDGWRILGWATKEVKDSNDKNHKNQISYSIGAFIGGPVADDQYDHKAWGNDDTEPLVLYAVWDRSVYTVKFSPNANTYSGSMANQTFSYGVEQKLNSNQYKVTGKRFNGWKDKNGTAYAEDYSASTMTLENEVTIELLAQWVDCTHKDGEHPGILSYTIDTETNTIIETCDCGGHTASVGLVGRKAYHDGKPHPATITNSGTLLADAPTIKYKSCSTKDGNYIDMAEGAVPTEIGFYEASITVENNTVSVIYEIQAASDTVSVDVNCIDGQRFGAFGGKDICDIAQDDAFTVLYSIRNLNTNYESNTPSLVTSQVLPAGTTIIMQANDPDTDSYSYWYKNIETETSEITLSDFSKMGGKSDDMFSYNFSETQDYRFVFDFSKVAETEQLSGNLETKLVYKHNSSATDDAVSCLVTIRLSAKEAFSLNGSADSLQINAPQSKAFNRWDNKDLVLVVTAKDGKHFPADARLTVKADKNYTYSKNAADRFVIPVGWSRSETVSMSLESNLASQKGIEYSVEVKLCVGDKLKNVSSQPQATEYETGASQDFTLKVANATEPSLKIDGTQKVVKRTDELNLNITMQGVDDCTVHATIQRKEADGYGGNFLDASVIEENNQFSLGGINEAGSYRLLVTVTKDKQELLTVPYYFVVQ